MDTEPPPAAEPETEGVLEGEDPVEELWLPVRDPEGVGDPLREGERVPPAAPALPEPVGVEAALPEREGEPPRVKL